MELCKHLEWIRPYMIIFEGEDGAKLFAKHLENKLM